jgi:hypothetical protein
MSRKWLMWAGCSLMVLAGSYWLWSRGYQNFLSYGMLLLCPAMHLLMMHRAGSPRAGRPATSPQPRDHSDGRRKRG